MIRQPGTTCFSGATPVSLPGAYKDIDLVIGNAKELVQVERPFNQIINVKRRLMPPGR